MPSSRLVSLPNAVIAPGNIDKQAAKRKIGACLNILPTTKIILYAGRLSDEKDPLLFLDTVKELEASGIEFTGILAGEGPLSEAVYAKIEHLDLGASIITPGFVNNIHELITASDLLLLTSKTEGTPMIVLEAMARGCVVVSTNVGGMADIIENDNNGILVDSRDPRHLSFCCQKLLENNKQLQHLKNSAEKTILNRYSLRAQIDEYQNRYLELWQ